MVQHDVLLALFEVISSRKGGDDTVSYTASLFAKGTHKIAQKVGEEGLETALAAVGQGKKEIIAESADLLFHLMVLWSDQQIVPADVMEELCRRQGISGLEEKANREE